MPATQIEPLDLAADTAAHLANFLDDARKKLSAGGDDAALAAGKILSIGGFQEQSVRSLNHVLANDPANLEALARLAFAYMRAEMNDAALAPAARLVLLDPTYKMSEITTDGHLGAYSIMGLTLLASGNKKAALDAFERAYAADNDDSIAWAYIAQLRDHASTINVSNKAAENPRFAGLKLLIKSGTLDQQANFMAASGAITRYVHVAVSGRPLTVGTDPAIAQSRPSREWLIDLPKAVDQLQA